MRAASSQFTLAGVSTLGRVEIIQDWTQSRTCVPALAQLLQQHRTASRYRETDDYVFTTRGGTPMHWTNLGSKALRPALTNAGLRPLRWHDLRHTFASLLIAGGANIPFVSRQLVHSSSQITLGVYAHLLDREEQAQRTRDMLETMLGDTIREGLPTAPSWLEVDDGSG